MVNIINQIQQPAVNEFHNSMNTDMYIHWVGYKENLQESHVLTTNYGGFLVPEEKEAPPRPDVVTPCLESASSHQTTCDGAFDVAPSASPEQ